MVTIPTQSTSDTSVGQRGGVPKFTYKSGEYYGPAYSGGKALGGTVSGTGLGRIVPFFAQATASFDRIAIYNTGASSTTCRLGIYEDNGGTPNGGALLDGGAELTLSGSAGDNAETISVTLKQGKIYWLYLLVTASFAHENCLVGEGDAYWSSLVSDDLLGLAAAVGDKGFATTASYGALPDPFSHTVAGWETGGSPYIRLRAT